MNRKKVGLGAGLAIFIVIAASIFLMVNNVSSSPQVPNPGHPWTQIECDNNLCVNTGTGNVGIGTTNPGAKLDVSGGEVKVGTSGAACTAANAGSIRYTGGLFYGCNGSSWKLMNTAIGGVIEVFGTGRRWTDGTYAISCNKYINPDPGYQYSGATGDATYTIDPDGAGGVAPFDVYCDMTTSNGGWTLAMKMDGNLTTFSYNATIWTDNSTFNPTSTDMTLTEHKNRAYDTVGFSEMRLGMNLAGTTNWQILNQTGTSLFALIADGTYRALQTPIGREAWKALIPGGIGSLQPYCNREGFNNIAIYYGSTSAGARIGILSNNENHCDSPDSRIAFGGTGTGCGQDGTNSVGNTATCSPDNGDRNTKVFGYVFVR